MDYEIKMGDPSTWAHGGLAAETPLDVSHHSPAVRQPLADQMRTARTRESCRRVRCSLLAVASSCDKNDGVITDLLRQVTATLDRTTRVRVFDSTGPGQLTARKRRDRPPVLADQRGTDALLQLRAALALRPDTGVMDWMQWPDLWLELLGRDDARLTTIGLLHPGWLRWESGGDLELQDPTAMVQWLTRWAPEAAATITERAGPSNLPQPPHPGD